MYCPECIMFNYSINAFVLLQVYLKYIYFIYVYIYILPKHSIV